MMMIGSFSIGFVRLLLDLLERDVRLNLRSDLDDCVEA